MTNVNFFFKVGHMSKSRSEVRFFCMSGKPLSQGTYMPNKGSTSNGSKLMTNVKVVHPTGGGRVVQRCHVSYVTGASN